jgi:1,4-dihydroxy-2-naphthoyl-CoA synthase
LDSPETQNKFTVADMKAFIQAFPGVSIAAVPGRAFGFGMSLVMQCDLSNASTDAEFAFDKIIHGLAP